MGNIWGDGLDGLGHSCTGQPLAALCLEMRGQQFESASPCFLTPLKLLSFGKNPYLLPNDYTPEPRANRRDERIVIVFSWLSKRFKKCKHEKFLYVTESNIAVVKCYICGDESMPWRVSEKTGKAWRESNPDAFKKVMEIEKLKMEIMETGEKSYTIKPGFRETVKKINELIEAVNKLLGERDE